jgi:hypothetical protein
VNVAFQMFVFFLCLWGLAWFLGCWAEQALLRLLSTFDDEAERPEVRAL